jgi:phage N-6-adenine-methyltransferase
MSMSAVSPVSRARQALEQAVTPAQSKEVEAMAQAAKAWAKERGDYEMVVEAAEVYILARRKTTELIVPQIRQGQYGRENHPEVIFLSDFNLTVRQWERRRAELAVPVEMVPAYISDCIENSATPTPTGLVRFANGPEIGDEPAANIIHVPDDSYEWFTPAEYIKAAREVMGGIDLDPASCAEANAVVKATRFYTRDDDGLAQPWAGRVWLNPPYNMPLIEDFCRKLTDEYEAGNVTAAVVLVNNSTDTGWFHVLLEAAPVVCFTRGRLKFWNGTDRLAARQGQALFYLGSDPDKFAKVFGAFGAVLRKYDN